MRRCVQWVGLLLVVALCLLDSTVEAYRRGDIIKTSKRSQYGGKNSEWSEVAAKFCPHFMVDKTVYLHGLNIDEYTSTMPYKIGFSFGGNAHATSWISVTDGKAKLLNFITFTFVYSGNEIKSLTWFADYHDGDHPGKFSGEFIIHYNWIEDHEVDTTFGLNVLFVGGFGAACALLTVALLELQQSGGLKSLANLAGDAYVAKNKSFTGNNGSLVGGPPASIRSSSPRTEAGPSSFSSSSFVPALDGGVSTSGGSESAPVEASETVFVTSGTTGEWNGGSSGGAVTRRALATSGTGGQESDAYNVLPTSAPASDVVKAD